MHRRQTHPRPLAEAARASIHSALRFPNSALPYRRSTPFTKNRCSKIKPSNSAPTTIRIHHELSRPSKRIADWMVPGALALFIVLLAAYVLRLVRHRRENRKDARREAQSGVSRSGG